MIVEYKPTYAPIIRSFYKCDYNKYDRFLDKINNCNFFIEEFIKLFNKSYDFVDKSRIKIKEITDNEEINYINYYLEKYENIFDIIGRIYDILEYDEEVSIMDNNIDSDQDLTDSVHISNILDNAAKNIINYDNIDETKDLILNNIHLLFTDNDVFEYNINNILPNDYKYFKKLVNKIKLKYPTDYQNKIDLLINNKPDKESLLSKVKDNITYYNKLSHYTKKNDENLLEDTFSIKIL